MKQWLSHPLVPYGLPLGAFFLIHLGFSGLHENAKFVTYPISVVVCIGLVVAFRHRLPPIFSFNRPWATVGVGLLAAAWWIVPYDFFATEEVLSSPGFNPGATFESPWVVYGLLAVRLLGFAVMIPLVEEIFWRGGLQRYIIKEEFEEVPIGTFTVPSFFGTVAMIVMAHSNQWQIAFIWAMISSVWFIHTKSVGNLILLHAVTNLTLGLYVLITGKWYFW